MKESNLSPPTTRGYDRHVAPLIAHYQVRLLSQQIHYFAFAFITPLGAHHHYVRQATVLLFYENRR